MTTNITIHPAFDAFYYSFYLHGLVAKSGAKQVHYSTSGFPQFRPNLYGHNHFACLIRQGQEVLRVFIDASDPPDLVKYGLEWCDLYAKVNKSENDQSQVSDTSKILAIGPSFGIAIWKEARALHLAAINYLKARRSISQPREFFAGYYRQSRYRLPITTYTPSHSERDYVFLAGSLWKLEPQTNTHRATFIEVCRSLPELEFEGGFAPRTKNDIPGFEELTMTGRVSFPDYLSKLKRSAVAFNTPAVASCHGWKLGEFLALGKAIISTPLIRELPAPLLHGVHVHYVDGSRAAIEEAVETICRNDSYRRKLEKGARAYFDTFLAPEAVINRILSKSRS